MALRPAAVQVDRHVPGPHAGLRERAGAERLQAVRGKHRVHHAQRAQPAAQTRGGREHQPPPGPRPPHAAQRRDAGEGVPQPEGAQDQHVAVVGRGDHDTSRR
ncbi:hypothetical protein [Georgenia yuyongxinii]